MCTQRRQISNSFAGVIACITLLTACGEGALSDSAPKEEPTVGQAITTEGISTTASSPDSNPAQSTVNAPETELALAAEPKIGCAANSDDIKSSTLSLINQARSSARSCGDTLFEAAPTVTWNSKLEAAALSHSKDMAQYNFFSHTGSSGLSVSDRVDATEYSWRTVGENIAAGQTTTDLVVEAWLTSPGHCANIMSADFKEIAVACVESSDSEYGTLWTNVLGASF